MLTTKVATFDEPVLTITSLGQHACLGDITGRKRVAAAKYETSQKNQ